MAEEALEATRRPATDRAAQPVSRTPAPGESEDRLAGRTGIDVPQGWWPSVAALKGFEAAGFAWAQVHAPPAGVLAVPRRCTAHAEALHGALEKTSLGAVVHAPAGLRLGSREADRAFEGLLFWCSEIGSELVVYHARAMPDELRAEQLVLFETRSLARLAALAERLGITIALENLAPTYPGPEPLAASPLALRGLAHRIGSERVAICLDLGHAHVIADLRHTSVERLCEPVLDLVALFHLHDNLGARWTRERPPELDPLRLDLHLSPGRGTLPWERVASRIVAHGAPLILEVHAPHRPRGGELRHSLSRLLG
jgi:sugar phosphate isomerase/epimerase